MNEGPTLLTESELSTLAGLARAMTAIDGRVTPAEQEAVLALRETIAEGSSDTATPYRGGARAEPLSEERWRQILERAADQLDSEDALQKAAAEVTRQGARDAIFALLAEIAIVDAIGPGEWKALEWLETEWAIQTLEAPDG